MAFNRRRFVQAAGAAAGAASLGFPAIVRSQSEPIRLGLQMLRIVLSMRIRPPRRPPGGRRWLHRRRGPSTTPDCLLPCLAATK